MLFEMNGTSAATGGWLMLLLQILALGGSIMVSSLLGRIHDQRALGVVVSLLCMTGFAGLAWHPAWAALWIGIAGFGLGSSLTLALAFISLRSSSHPQAASLSAMSQCLGYLIGAAGPLVCGIVRTHASSWLPILWGLAVVSIAQAWMAWGAGRRLHIGEKT
jgi:CP family cyanate transporter-like MFS transporter